MSKASVSILLNSTNTVHDNSKSLTVSSGGDLNVLALVLADKASGWFRSGAALVTITSTEFAALDSANFCGDVTITYETATGVVTGYRFDPDEEDDRLRRKAPSVDVVARAILEQTRFLRDLSQGMALILQRLDQHDAPKAKVTNGGAVEAPTPPPG